MARALRLHQAARELGVAESDALLMLREAGAVVRNRLSKVDLDALERVRQRLEEQCARVRAPTRLRAVRAAERGPACFVRALVPDVRSWKAAGDTLGVSAKTAQRWARLANNPLPVTMGKVRGRIVAYSADLLAWKVNGTVREPRRAVGRSVESWHALAVYLGAHRDTVRRWARQDGLPVVREPGRAVVAKQADLDRWLAGRGGSKCPSLPTPHRPVGRALVGTIAAEDCR